jgi:hypothetical protein
VIVRAAFHLRDINGIDEEAETFQFSGVLTLVWQDPRQAFDPAAAGVDEKFFTGAYQFDEIAPAWYPQVVLANVSGTASLEAPYAGTSGTASAFVLGIDIERQSFFMVFWMDRSSVGDRLSVSFVGILTAVAYLMVVTDRLPQIGYVTLIHAFLSLSFLTMCATVVVNLLVGACDRNGTPELGRRIDRFCRWFFPLLYAFLISGATLIAFTFY